MSPVPKRSDTDIKTELIRSREVAFKLSQIIRPNMMLEFILNHIIGHGVLWSDSGMC